MKGDWGVVALVLKPKGNIIIKKKGYGTRMVQSDRLAVYIIGKLSLNGLILGPHILTVGC